MNRLFAAYGERVVRYRWFVIIGWIALIIVSSRALPSLSSEVNNDNSQFLPASAPSVAASNLAVPLLGDTNNYSQVLVLAARTTGRLTPGDTAAVRREAAAARSLPRVTDVRELAISRDGHSLEVLVNAHVNQSNITGESHLITGLEHSFAIADPPAGLVLHVAGAVAANVANQQTSTVAGNRTQVLSLLFIVLLLLVIFRSLLAPVLTLLPSAVALIVSNRFIGALGAHGLKISEITQLLLIVLILGAGTDYGLFLVFRVREELRSGRNGHEAVAVSLARVGESITASAGTVIFALLSLLLASFGIYHDLGIPLAVGVAVMLLAGLTLLPALLAVFGRAAFWPSRTAPGDHREGLWGRVAVHVLRRPAWTLAIGVVIFAGLASAALNYHAGGFGGATNAPRGTDAAAGDVLLARYFPQSSVNPTNLILAFSTSVYEDPSVLVTAENRLEASKLFSKVVGPLNPTGAAMSPATFAQLDRRLGPPALLPTTEPARLAGVPVAAYNAYRASSFYVSADGRTIQFEVALRAGDPASSPAIGVTPDVRAALTTAGRAAGARATGVAGEAPALYDVDATSNRDLIRIVPIAILAIGILLGLVLRSAVAPLYLILSVALSYLAALGVAVLVFIDIKGDTGITFILPFLMFIFLLALGEDYNILIMTRIREEAHHAPLREAVAKAIGRTGPTITSAGMVLAGTFGVLAVAGSSGPGGSQIEAIGLGLGVGVLMDTFLVRTLLVPATVVLLGRLNWWPITVNEDVEPPAAPKELVAATVD